MKGETQMNMEVEKEMGGGKGKAGVLNNNNSSNKDNDADGEDATEKAHEGDEGDRHIQHDIGNNKDKNKNKNKNKDKSAKHPNSNSNPNSTTPDNSNVDLSTDDSGQPLAILPTEVTQSAEHLGFHERLQLLLPANIPPPASFETAGWTATMNLRGGQLPHRFLVGRAVLDANRHLRAVANKSSRLDNVFRTPELEVIAGDSSALLTQVREESIELWLDVREVYFCSRLHSERSRVLAKVVRGECIADVFCGVGPFALRAAREKGCRVLANDLNPACYAYLLKNIAANKLQVRSGGSSGCGNNGSGDANKDEKQEEEGRDDNDNGNGNDKDKDKTGDKAEGKRIAREQNKKSKSKSSSGRGEVEACCEDGRAFIRRVLDKVCSSNNADKDENKDKDKNKNESKNDHTAQTPRSPFDVRHFYMNLPALAADFLDVFAEADYDKLTQAGVPHFDVHVYCFVDKEGNMDNEEEGNEGDEMNELGMEMEVQETKENDKNKTMIEMANVAVTDEGRNDAHNHNVNSRSDAADKDNTADKAKDKDREMVGRARRRIEGVLADILPRVQFRDFHFVKNVSSLKAMLCVSFRILVADFDDEQEAGQQEKHEKEKEEQGKEKGEGHGEEGGEEELGKKIVGSEIDNNNKNNNIITSTGDGKDAAAHDSANGGKGLKRVKQATEE